MRKPLKINGSAYGNRTRLSALRGPCPEPIDERAVRQRLTVAEALPDSKSETLPNLLASRMMLAWKNNHGTNARQGQVDFVCFGVFGWSDRRLVRPYYSPVQSSEFGDGSAGGRERKPTPSTLYECVGHT